MGRRMGKKITTWKFKKDGRSIEIPINMDDSSTPIVFSAQYEPFGIDLRCTEAAALKSQLGDAIKAFQPATLERMLFVDVEYDWHEEPDDEETRIINPDATGNHWHPLFGRKLDLGIRRLFVDPTPIGLCEKDRWTKSQKIDLCIADSPDDHPDDEDFDLYEYDGPTFVLPDTPLIRDELARMMQVLDAVNEKLRNRMEGLFATHGIQFHDKLPKKK